MKNWLTPGIYVLAGSMSIGAVMGMSAQELGQSLLAGVTSTSTLTVLAVIVLVMFLGSLLAAAGSLKRITQAVNALIRSRRLALIFPSMLMGMLPVPAGAMLSAPMVEDSGQRMGLKPENKTFLNYWFRHVFEFIWPIYPGLILASAILDIPIYQLIAVQLPLGAVMIVVGLVFGLARMRTDYPARERRAGIIRNLLVFLFFAWPIVAIIVLVLGLKIDIVLSLSLIVGVSVLTSRLGIRRLLTALKESLSAQAILMVISVMIFKEVLNASGLLPQVPALFEYLRIPSTVSLFILPFLLGLISGLSLVPVGISFPILQPIIGVSEPNVFYAMLAYAGGVSGYLLSPLHLCLVLSVSYFRARFFDVWRMVLIAVAILDATAFALVLIQSLG